MLLKQLPLNQFSQTYLLKYFVIVLSVFRINYFLIAYVPIVLNTCSEIEVVGYTMGLSLGTDMTGFSGIGWQVAFILF